MDIDIFCLDNTEYAEFDAVNRGYRGDIYVRINEYYYNLNVYDIVRLQQDFELELEEYGVYTPDPNLVLVKEVNNTNIKEIVNHLIKSGYFNEIQRVSSKTLKHLNLLKLESK
ncbi:hypothetical protein [Flavobacterium sp. C4GT6]|uniref:hypothetical protein n=1 Tax=Flavobacterium sp. C4GT6 TaxID=3103818 RepID=UPI002ED49E3B